MNHYRWAIAATSTSFLRLPFRATRARTLAPVRTSKRPWLPWTAPRHPSWLIDCLGTRRRLSIHPRPRLKLETTPWTLPEKFFTTVIPSVILRVVTGTDPRNVSPVKITDWTSKWSFLVSWTFSLFGPTRWRLLEEKRYIIVIRETILANCPMVGQGTSDVLLCQVYCK